MATVKTVLVKGRCNSRGAYPLAVQVLHKRKRKFFIQDTVSPPVSLILLADEYSLMVHIPWKLSDA